MFEWWYFRKFGTSFIEQLSVSHLGPLLGVGDDSQHSHGLKAGWLVFDLQLFEIFSFFQEIPHHLL